MDSQERSRSTNLSVVFMIKTNDFPSQVSFYYSLSTNDSENSIYYYDALTLERIEEQELYDLIGEENAFGQATPLPFGIPVSLTESGYKFNDYVVVNGRAEKLGYPWIVRNIDTNDFYVLFEKNDGKWTESKGNEFPAGKNFRKEVPLMIPEVFRSSGKDKLPVDPKLRMLSRKENNFPIIVSRGGKKNCIQINNQKEVKNTEEKKIVIEQNVKKEKLDNESLETILSSLICSFYKKSVSDPKTINYCQENLPFIRDFSTIINDVTDKRTEDGKLYVEEKEVIVDSLLQPLTLYTRNSSEKVIRTIIVTKKDGSRCITTAVKASGSIYMPISK